MPGRNTKPIALVQGHRTKAEIAQRKKAEKELLTGVTLKEWKEVKENPVSHKEFLRIKKLLRQINHDDDLYSAMINTHCKLKAEEYEFEVRKSNFENTIEELETLRANEEIGGLDYIKTKASLQGHILACDKAIMNKRKMMLSISKENIMTIQSALRSIPKKEKPKEESAMAKMIKLRAGNNA